jgi:predicted DNA-binding transcriptional regulator AlpA
VKHKAKSPKPSPPPVELSDPKDLVLIGKQEVLARVPVTFTSIWRMAQDGRFPRARVIGNRVCWYKHEVDAWLAAVPLRGYLNDDDGVKHLDTFQHVRRRKERAKAKTRDKSGA